MVLLCSLPVLSACALCMGKSIISPATGTYNTENREKGPDRCVLICKGDSPNRKAQFEHERGGVVHGLKFDVTVLYLENYITRFLYDMI